MSCAMATIAATTITKPAVTGFLMFCFPVAAPHLVHSYERTWKKVSNLLARNRCEMAAIGGIVLVSQALGGLNALDKTSLRDRRQPRVGRLCREPGDGRRDTVRDVAGSPSGRALRHCDVHQRTTARRPRPPADVVRQP